MWKYLYDSVAGTSHGFSGTECQDSSFVTPYLAEAGGNALILICADGAGSAPQSKVGSSIACRAAAGCAAMFFDNGGTLETIIAETLRGWLQVVHDSIADEAMRRDLSPRDLACTLLIAVVSDCSAAFIQVGDGAIIKSTGSDLHAVFWPQNGEYHNTTYFVTDAQYQENALLEIVHERIENIALFTDGLQMLALDYAKRSVHTPFFTPLFDALRQRPTDDLQLPLKEFLGSDAVNQRTDDDKTLVLASRAEGESDTAI